MIPTFWTDERVEILKSRWAQHWTARKIAALLGCSRNAVLGKAGRLGLPRVIHRSGRTLALASAASGQREHVSAPTAGAGRRRAEAASAAQAGVAMRSHEPKGRTKRSPSMRPIALQAMPFEPVSRKLSIVELDAASCRWIAGDDGCCCGHPAAHMLRNGQDITSPFCVFHSARAYRVPQERSHPAALAPRHGASKTRVDALAASLHSAARRP